MPSLSDVHHPHHHLHLEFESVRELPESHAWPTLHDHPCVSEPVPVIDLADPKAAEFMARACVSWGAFQVTGHGVAPRLLEAIDSEMRRLFALPIQQKLKAARPPDGISGYGLVPISSFFAKLMWSEGFTIAGSPLDHARKLWPHDPDQFCDVIERYDQVMKALAGRLISLMLLSLGLRHEELDWAGQTGKPLPDLAGVLRLNSYPACPDPDRAMGMAAHADSSLLTILYQSSTSGLQLLRAEDQNGPTRWVTVPPLPGALVVIVGDLFHILSNGRFRSVVHRVVVNRSRQRVSVAYFSGPPAGVTVSPIGKLVGPGRAPAYRAVTWAEYLGLKRKLFDKALATIEMTEES
uniref:gibberellin 3beta-dioxygenase n=1 Tax=Cocos nucifera TaxID=13894 RepID=A0A1W5YN19_COCNU|nr:Gibberellin 3-beta-dioxygenase [Cocos nucifera]